MWMEPVSLPPAHSRCLFPCCPHVYVFYLTTLKVCMLSHLFPCSTTRTWPNTAALRCLFCLSFVCASSHSGSTLQPKWHFKWVYLALCWFLSHFQAHVCLMTASKSFSGGPTYSGAMLRCTWPFQLKTRQLHSDSAAVPNTCPILSLFLEFTFRHRVFRFLQI